MDAHKSSLLSPETLIHLPKVGLLITSPSGEKALFSQSSYSSDSNKSSTIFYWINLVTSEIRPLPTVSTDGTPYEPVFLDDSHLAFLQARDGSEVPHVYVVNIDSETQETYQLTSFLVEIGSIKYHAASQILGFSASVYDDGDLESVKAKDESAEKKDSGMVYDGLPVRLWNTYLPPKDKKNNIFVVPVTFDGAKYIVNGAPINLLKGTGMEAPHPMYGDADDYDFSPDGKHIAFASKPHSPQSAWQTTQHIYLTSTEGGSIPQVINGDLEAYSCYPKYAPDGTLAYLQMFQPGYDADRLRIVVYNGKTRRDVTKTWQQTAISLAFSPNSQTIYTTADEHGHLKIFAINLQTEEIKTLTHEHTATLVCMAKNDLIFRLASMNHPHVIHRLNTTTLELKPYGITPELQALFKGVDLPKPEEFWFEGALGDKVHGWLLKPANFEQGKKYPVAFLVHGGPQMPFRDNWVLDWHPQIYTSAGYAVVGINRHGSTGFGREFCDCIGENWGSYPYIDLEKGLTHVLKHNSFLDTANVVGIGFSFGGYLINWLNGHSNQFKAFVNHGGMFSLSSVYYGTDELAFPEREFGGPPFQAQTAYDKWSPSNFVHNWKTPTLVIHGGQDYRIPETEGIATFTALQRQGIPSRFLFFPDEPHSMTKPVNLARWYEEEIENNVFLGGWNDRNIHIIAAQTEELDRLRRQICEQSLHKNATNNENIVVLRLRNHQTLEALLEKEKLLQQRDNELERLREILEAERNVQQIESMDLIVRPVSNHLDKRQLNNKELELREREKQLEEDIRRWELERAEVVKPALQEVEDQLRELKIKMGWRHSRREFSPRPEETNDEQIKKFNRLAIDVENDKFTLKKLQELATDLKAQKSSHQALLDSHAAAMAEKDKLLQEQQEALSLSHAQLTEAHKREMEKLQAKLVEAERRTIDAVDSEIEQVLHEFEIAEHSHILKVEELERSHKNQISMMAQDQKQQLRVLKSKQHDDTKRLSWRPCSENDPGLVTLRRTGGPGGHGGASRRVPALLDEPRSLDPTPKDRTKFDVIDVAASQPALQYMKRQNNGGSTRGRAKELPQVFVGGYYRGQYQELLDAIEQDTLNEFLYPADKDVGSNIESLI
ncbi:Dipeptidyl-peptidase 5 [Umbelopsis nana]